MKNNNHSILTGSKQAGVRCGFTFWVAPPCMGWGGYPTPTENVPSKFSFQYVCIVFNDKMCRPFTRKTILACKRNARQMQGHGWFVLLFTQCLGLNALTLDLTTQALVSLHLIVSLPDLLVYKRDCRPISCLVFLCSYNEETSLISCGTWAACRELFELMIYLCHRA